MDIQTLKQNALEALRKRVANDKDSVSFDETLETLISEMQKPDEPDDSYLEGNVF